jgi:hypothetical protein
MKTLDLEPEDKVLQIIPAIGWYARLEAVDGGIFDAPLACWALIERPDGTREVHGLEAHEYVSTAEDDGGFKEYVHESRLLAIPAGKQSE